MLTNQERVLVKAFLLEYPANIPRNRWGSTDDFISFDVSYRDRIIIDMVILKKHG